MCPPGRIQYWNCVGNPFEGKLIRALYQAKNKKQILQYLLALQNNNLLVLECIQCCQLWSLLQEKIFFKIVAIVNKSLIWQIMASIRWKFPKHCIMAITYQKSRDKLKTHFYRILRPFHKSGWHCMLTLGVIVELITLSGPPYANM